MATPTRLSLYNGALRVIGERKLATLAENREPRRMLDDAWDNNVVTRALEAGDWLFAMRSMMYDYSPSVEPDFGFRRAFNKPDDYVRTSAVASDEYFMNPLTSRGYADEAGFWFSDLDTIYVKYVSKDASFGLDYSRWPQTFVRYLEALMASEIVMPLKQSQTEWERVQGLVRDMLAEAKSNNAMAEGAKFPPASSWVRSRMGGLGWGRRGER
jgi:hypothetical protein